MATVSDAAQRPFSTEDSKSESRFDTGIRLLSDISRESIGVSMKRRIGGANPNRGGYRWLLLPLLAVLAFPAIASQSLPVVSKWGRFEYAFQSTLGYSNALQDVSLSGVFPSPLGDTNQVYGFWDGDRTWLVRFSPNLPGRWSFRSSCSDKAN